MAYSYGQTTYLPLGSEEHFLLDRLETQSGSLSDQLFLSVQPLNRKDAVQYLFNEKSNFYNRNLSNTDNFNINRAMALSNEWMEGVPSAALTRRQGLWNTFYTYPPDFIQVNKHNFFLSVNPVLSAEGAYQKDNTSGSFLLNSTQGVAMRARLSNVLGLSLNIADNYEQPPAYYADYIDKYQSMPGAAAYRKIGDGYQYLTLSGYADVGLIKDHVNLTLGYDRQFIGDGMRSLFIADFSAPMPFVRINTKIWKLNYQNLYMLAQPQFPSDPALREGRYKYLTMHHLSMNITRWLNVGLFESVTFSRDGHFEFGYMNPIIFYRAIERGMGSPDKVAIGVNAKALAWKTLQLYGQFLLNEFTAKEFFGNKGYMHNKWGAQLGFKYFNAFKLDNLDIQGEMNIVRPYTYQHYSEANYSNNNLPIAHPLGAGFREFSGNIRYQPIPRLWVNARAMFYQQGVDTGGINYGNDILKNYKNTPARYGVHIINGLPAECLLLGLSASYEIWTGLCFDLGGTYRNYHTDDVFLMQEKTAMVHAGFRLNIARKDYWSF